ncbi:hypothetical protein [Actinoplanes sp. L3-i22]|uniref:hypothetical protein n=1 Tax=Actinoplanes sp. L3-i22 TaxID=2836373 RepID=UPI001C77D00A|nr:hypothetical protein [Actinoplanes sp. L3-i22]BCY13233.1 hypothetical protein L3i22_083210 [Actinoplanes sp. L3-i22]
MPISATTQTASGPARRPARRAVEFRFIHDPDITETAEYLDPGPASVAEMINQALAHLRSTMQAAAE